MPDGDDVGAADRAYLRSLTQNPFFENPYFGRPLPTPDVPGVVEQHDGYERAIVWLGANAAFCDAANGGRGGVYLLADPKLARTVSAMRDFMRPYDRVTVNKETGKITSRSPVDAWLRARDRLTVAEVRMRPGMARPIFAEHGQLWVNSYWPPLHPAEGGTVEAFAAFLAHLVPDEAERAWLWQWLAHKVRKPWIPMVAVVMVAEAFGSGRGTLFEILGLLLGQRYVWTSPFGVLTGSRDDARFNFGIANSLLTIVHEANEEGGERQAQRRQSADHLKIMLDPAPVEMEAQDKKIRSEMLIKATSTMIASNHRNPLKLPADDRRVCVLKCGPRLTAEAIKAIRAWMEEADNIGTLQRHLLHLAVAPQAEFDPLGAPPMFAGKLEMVAMSASGVETAFEDAVEALGNLALYTIGDMTALMGFCSEDGTGPDFRRLAINMVRVNGYRLVGPTTGGVRGRLKVGKKLVGVYARTAIEQKQWAGADSELIRRQLKLTREHVAEIASGGAFSMGSTAKENDE